ncbi:hypothetical protein [Mucilaginibacter antarcticus]|uniref:Secreted protein n=1 Tax=Mucilaginibacter antarcticus TaxID=1855725 RepID=A0ABW5XN51_9SPHI
MPNRDRRGFIRDIATLTAFGVLTQAKLMAAVPTGKPKTADPVKERDLIFVFQGDSITDGQRSRNGDLNNNIGHGYAFSITSRLGADFPDRNLTFLTEAMPVAILTAWQAAGRKMYWI